MTLVIDLFNSDSETEDVSSTRSDAELLKSDGMQNQSTSRESKRQRCDSASTSSTSASSSLATPFKPQWPLMAGSVNPVRLRLNGQERLLLDTELPKHAPATLVRRALPKELADKLLAQLLKDVQSWRSQDWVVHGQRHVTPRTSAEYWLRAEHMPEEFDAQSRVRVEGSSEMREASTIVEALVKECRPWSQWKPSLALGNCYSNGHDSVGWHSDFLSALGPRPIIVGLALGATRVFRLRHEPSNTVVSIPMPHNSVVVMWDDCQEDWQHCVPRQADSSVGRHPIAGLIRISLTFRMVRPELDSKRIACRCGRSSILKSKNGKYYLACSPMASARQCGFWEPCTWAQIEADRLREELRQHSDSTKLANAITQKNLQSAKQQDSHSLQKEAMTFLGVASGTLERPVIDIT